MVDSTLSWPGFSEGFPLQGKPEEATVNDNASYYFLDFTQAYDDVNMAGVWKAGV